MTYTTLVRTTRRTYRVWDADMVRGRDLPTSVSDIMYGILDRDQRNELDKYAACELTDVQVRDLGALIGDD